MATRRFRPEPDEQAIDVMSEADVTEEEAEQVAARFIRKHGREFPRLAAAVQATEEEDET